MSDSGYCSCCVMPLTSQTLIFRIRLTAIIVILRWVWTVRKIVRIFTLAVVLEMVEDKTPILFLIDFLDFLIFLSVNFTILLFDFSSSNVFSFRNRWTEIISIYDIHFCGDIMYCWANQRRMVITTTVVASNEKWSHLVLNKIILDIMKGFKVFLEIIELEIF